MLSPCNNNGTYSDQNPYWYKFTCYKSGTLGFIITPLASREDYDWQLFDVTGHNTNDVYTDKSLYVSSNWAGTLAPTGTSANAPNAFECASDTSAGVSTFSKMPNIIQGHEYLLMISHFTPTQAGYTLEFPSGAAGGTASIVNPVVPKLNKAYGVCDGTEIKVLINKRIDCKTIASDGSDFTVSGPIPVTVVGASGSGCRNGFDSDTILLKVATPLVLGNYTVTARAGTDGNTLMDNCQNSLAPGENAGFFFIPGVPTPMDSIAPVICISDSLRLVFRKPILCSSVAPDGSDFTITGPVPVTIKSAKGVCVSGSTSTIDIFLTAPIRANGSFVITLRNGSDGNTLLDECNEVTPAGSALGFTTKNITVADFNPTVSAGCRRDTAFLNHNGNGGANLWAWTVDGTPFSSQQNAQYITNLFGDHNVKLTVTNGICLDTVSHVVNCPDHTAKALFSSADTLCPTDAIVFTDESTGSVTDWRWNFGNGNISNSRTPPPQNYLQTGKVTKYAISLEVENTYKCIDNASKMIVVLASCYIAVPSAFTPNGDGLNDYLYPLNAFKADNIDFRVYNRYGQILFESHEWSRKWDGRYKGVPQPSGTYVWVFNYTERDSGNKVSLKGTAVLLR